MNRDLKAIIGVSPVGSKPSSLQMMKLLANPEFRSVAKKLAQELKDAGVDLDSKVKCLILPHRVTF